MAIGRGYLIDVAMNTARIQQDVAKVRSDFEGLGKTFSRLGGILAGAFSVRALAQFSKAQIDMGDALQKNAQRLGVTVEQLSAYTYASQLAGTNTETVYKSLVRLSSNLRDAVITPTAEAARAFKELGFSVTDASGNLKSSDSALRELAALFADIEDGSQKTALAVKIFGKSGAEIIPLLNDLEALTAEAEAAGAVISKEFADASATFNDNLTRMKEEAGSLLRDAIFPLIEGFNSLYAITRQGDQIRLEGLKQELQDVRKEMEETSNIGWFFSDSGFNELADKEQELEEMIARLEKKVGTIPQAFTAWDYVIDQMDTFNKSLKITTTESEAMEKKIEALELKVRMLNATEVDAIRIEAEALKQQGASATQVERFIAAKEKELEIQWELNNAKQREQDLKSAQTKLPFLDQQSKLPESAFEQIQTEYDARLNMLSEFVAAKQTIIANSGLSELEMERQFSELQIEEAARRRDFQIAAAAQTAGGIAGTLQDLYVAAGQKNKNLFKLAKSFAIAEAIMNTYAGADQALRSLPYPANIAAAASVIAHGLANVRKIQSTEPGGSAGGGGGGGGGAVAYRGTAAQQPSFGPVNNPSQNITVNVQNGVGSAAYWQYIIDEVIVPGLNDAQNRNINLNLRET